VAAARTGTAPRVRVARVHVGVAGMSPAMTTALRALALQLLVVASAAAVEPPSPPEPRWEVIVTPYVWAPRVQGSETLRNVKVDVDVSLRDILERLDLALKGNVEVRYRDWRVVADGLWAALSDDFSQRVLTARVKTDLDVTLVVGQLAAGRRVLSLPASWLPWGRRGDDPRRLDIDLFAGARYWHFKTDVVIRTRGPIASRKQRLSATSDWVDPVVGTRLQLGLTGRLALALVSDVGGFGIGSASEVTWQAWGGLGYRLSDHWTLRAGYRALAFDRTQGELRSDLVLHGPLVGTSFHFR
jgi:hypothetical protein